MKQKFAKLIDVKSIVTILLTAVFCVLALRRTISAEQFITVFTVVISFYFGTHSVTLTLIPSIEALWRRFSKERISIPICACADFRSLINCLFMTSL